MTGRRLDAMDNPFLRKLEGFGPLSPEDRAALLMVSVHTQFVPAGTDLAREGDPIECVFLILEGMACRYKLRTSGVRQIMAYLVPGDMGDLDAALLTALDHSIGTLSDCEVVRIAPDTIQDLLQRPAVASALRRAKLVDEATAREWLVNVGRRAAIERIAHVFCEVLVRMQVVGRAQENTYAWPLRQPDLADTTGLTPIHVNRTLRELRQQGLIELKGRRLKILDLPRLKKIAEFRSNYLQLGDQAAA